MQAAVNAAANLPSGGSVYLQAGNYWIEGIHVPSNVDVYGDNRERTTLYMKSANATLFTVTGGSNVRIHDMFLVGTQTAVATAGALIHAVNAQGCQFTNLQFTDFYYGLIGHGRWSHAEFQTPLYSIFH
jgi:hypothetical protein